VALAVFKTDVAEDLGQAGSIPVRLRQANFRHLGRQPPRRPDSGNNGNPLPARTCQP
jgi:hypothetical protein